MTIVEPTMSKWRKINLLAFLVLVFSTSGLVYSINKVNLNDSIGKPWHLLPDVHEDSLSQEYLQHYRIIDKVPLKAKQADSSRTNVFILVDAWGVPIQESKLEQEFGFFENLPHQYALHQRLANRNKHAERVELRNPPQGNIYLFGGDSLEYDRPGLVRELGFDSTLFCQNCNDSAMIAEIDSLLGNDSLRFIAWTTQSSRLGDEISLRRSLKQIADFAKRHPDVRIVVQGTHRPILGTRETKNAYKSHWVPVAILN